MPAKQTVATNRPDPNVMKQEGLTVLTPLAHAVDALVVKTPADYLAADDLLARIRRARKTWGDRVEKIIRPIRQGLDELYGLNREVDRPLEALEESVKGRMKEFKLEEMRLIREAERKQEAEVARLQAEADAKLRAASVAATPQMRGKLQTQAARAIEQQQTVLQRETPAPTFAESSTTRPVKKVRVHNPTHFLQGIIDGYVPDDCVAVVQARLNQYLKDDPDGMAAWPGVEVYDDVQIVGR